MGSCASRSPAPASSPASSSGRRVATAKVIRLDGSLTQYPEPITANEALGHDGASSFLCSSDELRFDEPPRALADEEELQPGWLYFVLPMSMLRLALSGHEMAALAVRASSALAVASGVVASPPRRKTVAGANGKRAKTARVAPLVAPDEGAELADGGWSHQHSYDKYGGARKTVRSGGDETVAKTRKGAGYRNRGARHRRRAVGMQRLSAILEADEF
uniref:Uncharacterized protein n=1 Tax=Avena sativa TaxID=4498 RepID=A0ACD5Y0V3_AVESA